MAQVQERHTPAPLSATDRRILAATAAGVTLFAGAVAYTLGTAAQRPALLAGSLVATVLVTVIALRYRRDDEPRPTGLHRNDPRGFRSRQERRFWGEEVNDRSSRSRPRRGRTVARRPRV